MSIGKFCYCCGYFHCRCVWENGQLWIPVDLPNPFKDIEEEAHSEG